MTVAIKRANGDIFWFDAVVQYSRTAQNEVTKHPVEKGFITSDHIIRQNKTFTISGVWSDADFNWDRPIAATPEQSEFKTFVNNTRVETGPRITMGTSPLVEQLPSSVQQFLGQSTPSVEFTVQKKVKPAEQVASDLEAIRDNAELVTLIEYRPNGTTRSFPDCALTNLTFPWDAESGDAYYPNLTFEQLRFTESQYKEVPKAVKSKAAKKTSLGAKQADTKASETTATTDPRYTPAERDKSALFQGTKMEGPKKTVEQANK